MIIILYLLLGTQSTPTTDITMTTLRITIVAVVGGVLGLVVLITGILLCVLCIVYFKKRLKGTLVTFDRILVVISNVLTLHHNDIYYILITYY